MLISRKRQLNVKRIIFCLLPNLISGYIVFILLNYRLFPDKYLYITIAVIVVANLLSIFLLLFCKKKALHGVGYFFSIMILVISMVGSFLLTSAVNTLSKISNGNKNTIIISVVVLKDSNIYLAQQLSGLSVSAVSSLNTQYVDDISKDLKLKDVAYAGSYTNLIDELYKKSSEVILFNESYRDLVKSENEDFDTDTRIIKQYSYDVADEATSLVDGSKPFNLYISGIDTYGPITTASLSDVNIVATINPITKKILLTTIPRDSYVPIALGGNNQYDKLTHAGIYGIESSIITVENILGIDLGAYIRVNFNSLINMVDILGGIEVDNPVAFNSGGKFFSSGIIVLDGEAALVYSRERKSLANGDNDRGVNQERVIIALFDKVIQPSTLVNYQGILGVIGDSMQTNLSTTAITEMINMQLDSKSKSKWKIEMTNVSGKPAMGLSSYAMPDSYLYFTKLDDQSIIKAKDKINSIISE